VSELIELGENIAIAKRMQ